MFEQEEGASEPPASPEPSGFDADLLLGAPSAQSIALLLSTDPGSLEREDAVAAAAGAELAKRLLDAVQLRCLARAAGTRRDPGELSEVGQELSAATNLAPITASCRTDLACETVARLPRTLGHLEAGRYTLRHVEIVERATRQLTDEQSRAVDRQLPARPLLLKRRLAEAIARIDPELLNRKIERARESRGVDFWTDALDGTAGLSVHGPLASAATIKAAVDTLAGPTRPGECRSLDQRRFDAVHDWARTVLGLADPTIPRRAGLAGAAGLTGGTAGDGGSGDDGGRGAAGGRPGSGGSAAPASCGACGRTGPARIPINVTIGLEALLRLSEAPGDLNGEPIPAEVARELAADGRWRRFVIERATGRLLDVGAATYRPGAALARFVRGRDRTCTFPSCTRPAERCDLDHITEFSRGGPTTAPNLGPKCRSHHRLRHEYGWTTSRTPEAHTDWTAPSGRVYRNPADQYGDDPALNAYLTRGTAFRLAREKAERDHVERLRRPPSRPSRPPGRAPDRPAGRAADPWTTPPQSHAEPDEEPPF